LQQKALPTFHYALKPEGFLFLGASESIGSFTDLFEPVDKKHKIYTRKAAPTPAIHLPARKEHDQRPSPPAPLPSDGRGGPRGRVRAGQGEGAPEGFPSELNAQREADRVTVNQFAPPGVLINDYLQILQFRGPTSAYLEPPTGKASFEVLKMAREGLMLPLRAAINKARKENKVVRKENVRVNQNGKTRTVTVEVIPLKNLKERCFLILFEDAGRGISEKETKETKKGRKETPPALPPVKSSRRVAELESELAETRDYVQSIQEQHEAVNEELQASNEEVTSANEELQSVNEELETSKEEMESANEELTTVNEEMANRNAELNRLNSDLVNLQTSTKLPIVLLGRDLTIRRFSGQAEKQFGLLAADVGRPISHIRHNLNLLDLEALAAEVIANVRECEREVQDKEGRWHSLRVRPYMTLDNKVDGAVLVLVDIDAIKQKERLEAALDFAQSTVDTVREPLLVLDGELRVRSAGRSFYNTFGASPAETIGRYIYDLGNGQWNIPKLRELLEHILPENAQFNDFEVEHNFENLGPRTMLLNARRLEDAASGSRWILLAIEDVTERKRADELLQQRTDKLQEAVGELEAFSYSVAHDLRAPLRAMQGYAQALLEQAAGQLTPQNQSYVERIQRAAARLDLLTQEVLTYSRLARTELQLHPVNLEQLTREVIEQYPEICPPRAQIEIRSPLLPVMGHEALLTQVLCNLLVNACKFVAPETVPKVVVRTVTVGRQVRIWVEDNGIGIAPEHRDRLFKIFGRIHPEHKYEGTGIGLAIVKKAAERMGGTAGFESEPGNGSRFWVQLNKAE
ncbi:MAG: ATP-binding protein, partial [Verrucomicrobia subdivision 3 bacterium]|nr:ATP-binding protein [Limisphaerales bacterium]